MSTDRCLNVLGSDCKSAAMRSAQWIVYRLPSPPSGPEVAEHPESSRPLRCRVDARMRSLDENGLRRTLRQPAGIDLSSNDYLGFAHHPRIKAAMAAAVEREGAGSTGSRLLRGERDSFAALERRFAQFKGTERALYFSSGYLANIAVMTTFAEAGDVIISDAHNHASLIDGMRLSSARGGTLFRTTMSPPCGARWMGRVPPPPKLRRTRRQAEPVRLVGNRSWSSS